MDIDLKIGDHIIINYKGQDKTFGTIIAKSDPIENDNVWEVLIEDEDIKMFVPESMLRKI